MSGSYSSTYPRRKWQIYIALFSSLPVRWKKPDLHVLEQTVIKPPYAVENVLEKNDSSKAKSERDYVRKLVGLVA